jgi:Golgi nucleoside diphosphatase
MLKNSTTWKHKTGKTVILPPQESVTKLCEELQSIEYFDTSNKSLIGKLLRGEKKQLYGWSFIGMAISSQDTDASV